MSKKIIVSLVSICFVSVLFAQQNGLNNFNKEREHISKKGLTVLASYAVVNIIYGSIAASKGNGTNKYFNEMNAIWNGITLGIAGLGYLTAKKEGILSYNESLKKQQNIEKLFLFNAGLDVAYIAAGALTKERANTATKNPARLKGYGESIMLQGGVLLLFDAVMYAIHNKHGKSLYKMGDNIKLAATQNGVGVLIKL